MKQYVYFAIFCPVAEGVRVRFHDFPELVTTAISHERAVMSAADALTRHLRGRETVPDASDLTQIRVTRGEQVLAIGVEC